MKRRVGKRAAIWVALAFGFASLGDDCDGDIVNDPTFRDWCGDTLCQWKLDAGHIAPVPTWNVDDLGVSFLDQGTQISQATTESGATCILFTSVANIDPAADMTIGVDFNSDGSIDYTAPLGSTQWESVQTEITAPAAYQGITFFLTKGGTGTAILAEMRIQSSSGCTAQPPSITGLAFGEKCEADAGDTCATGLTCFGVSGDQLCSQCSDAVSCANGAVCSTRSVFFPSQCGPGQGLGASGDPCLVGTDCMSGTCKGAMPVALGEEAGPCDLDAALGDADPSNCQWYAARGGTCD
jgi:hypothetical protein